MRNKGCFFLLKDPNFFLLALLFFLLALYFFLLAAGILCQFNILTYSSSMGNDWERSGKLAEGPENAQDIAGYSMIKRGIKGQNDGIKRAEMIWR